jgi:hypothetical protein
VSKDLARNLEVAAAAIKSKLDAYIAVPKAIELARSEYGH